MILFLFGVIVIYVTISKKEKYGCNCENRDYIFLEETSDNKYYKCSICETKDHLWFYKGGVCSINERMLNFYNKKIFEKLNGPVDPNSEYYKTIKKVIDDTSL